MLIQRAHRRIRFAMLDSFVEISHSNGPLSIFLVVAEGQPGVNGLGTNGLRLRLRLRIIIIGARGQCRTECNNVSIKT
jgi:hypothetical protein